MGSPDRNRPGSAPLASSLAALSRRFAAFRRRNSQLRHRVPASWARGYSRARSLTSRWRRLYLKVEHRSAFDNVFHCCVHKTGSQWIKSILGDPMVFRYSGLSTYTYQSFRPEGRPVGERTFGDAFPPRSIVTPLYITYENYLAVPKPGPVRAFFVQRDPRDLIVSWYHSMRDTHIAGGAASASLLALREQLRALPEQDGLRLSIDRWHDTGEFTALRSWASADGDPAVRVVRYEDLVGGEGLRELGELFEFLDIGMSPEELAELHEAYGFRRLTGREPGEADPTSHVRKAAPGEWRDRLDPELVAYLDEVSDGLPAALGYEA